jgi:hypothetical protein
MITAVGKKKGKTAYFPMKFFRRYPLIPVATLGVYLAVHVLADALHYHGMDNATPRGAKLEFQTGSAADGDDEETCLLCAVLHLAQIAPTALHVEPATTLDSKVLSAAALIRPHPLETATHSRGPPLI